MKSLKKSFAAKLIALILLAVFAVTAVGSGLAVIMCYEERAYELSYGDFMANIQYRICEHKMYETTKYGVDRPDTIMTEGNFSLNVYELSDTGREREIYKGFEEGGDYQWKNVLYTQYVTYKDGHREINPMVSEATHEYIMKSLKEIEDVEKIKSYRVEGYILPLSVNDSIANEIHTAELFYNQRYNFIIAVGLSLVLCLLLFIFLMAAAGHKRGVEGIYICSANKIPFDLLTLLAGTPAFFILVFGVSTGLGGNLNLFGLSIFALCAAACCIISSLYCMSFAARVKNGGFIKGLWKGCLIYKVLRWIWDKLKAALHLGFGLFKKIPSVIRPFAVFLLCMAFEFMVIILNIWEGDNILLWWLITRFFLCFGAVYLFLCLKELRKGAKELAAGNESYKIDTKRLVGSIKEQAEDLNNIGAGISKAVDERMKSERFKTELITNVSHDIKTPLTSIVNYVDLLKKEKPENERMEEYIEVLSRQSAKLKKLIEDLIEASKASSGSMPVNLERLEPGVLIDQTAGEYSEKLEEKNLQLIVTKPEEKIEIMADGRHMWRIFDNLMNNVLKYALPGTRVYLELARQNDEAVISFKNISRDRLSINPEELTERFKRGDSSRNTEGSGLGLSIAQSLTALQQGEMKIELDGDLFKIILRFKAI